MIVFDSRTKKILKAVGSGTRGAQFVEVLEKIKNEITSVDNIQSNTDYGAQVEGRKIAKDFLQDLIDTMSSKESEDRPPIHHEDYT